ncbi:ATP-binding protein [Kaistia dalseonensis]|uniref:histidine kinase n=1 Tax=Kaistia dalseonensis TaxID=410840 RepID=A0ABU0H011_9HYPH|nr:ATP-binding protein [Kaistia dalseonensis]MCX5493095.1 ATP-binding protein [Kaistia dalseonensis]MDQ0435650.1 signal transduction histidine kinase [Kaistia dalseonensis]
MRFNSLAFRLIAGASAWAAVALLVAGVILTSLYRDTVERAFDERLNVYLKTLVGNLAAQTPGQLGDPGNLGEQRFELIYSGWYWQVRQAGGPVLLASRSLATDTLDLASATKHTTVDGMISAAMTGPDGQQLRVLQRTITFDADHRYDVLIAGNVSDLEKEIRAFQATVALTLAIFGIGLVAATAFQIRWGLRPLDQLRHGLAELRSGREQRFEGPLPAELQPLVAELNALMDSNQEIIERSRTHVGNLAHALKTPLSVITNEARSGRGPLADKVGEQAEIMRTQINHHLDRARIAARSKVIGAITEVEPVLARLARAMRRIHGDRDLEIDLAMPPDIRFRGEQQDLEEMVGNLVDNACKWAKSAVRIEVIAGAGPDGAFTILIDDDGPGLTEDEMKEATRRGKRLDESKPGSGLGLSIVTELAGLYGGALTMARAPLGGLRAELRLPMV